MRKRVSFLKLYRYHERRERPVPRFISSLITLACTLVCSVPAFGEPFEDLPVGSTLPEVLKAWGHPAEKIERGVKHEVRWNYSGGAFVLFKNGKVVDWKSSRGRSPESIRKAAEPTAVSEKSNPEMGDLVRDIAREVPGGPDVPLAEPPGGAAGQGSLMPNPVPPQADGRAAGGEVLDETEMDQ